MKCTNLVSGQSFAQKVFLPSESPNVSDGIFPSEGIAQAIIYEAKDVQSNDYYTWNIYDSIIPRTFYVQDNNVQSSREIDWRVFYSRSILVFRQVIKLAEFTEFEYGYYFDFPTLLAIEVPQDGATSVQVQLKSNVDLDAIRVYCSPCSVLPNQGKTAEIRNSWLG